MRTGYRPWLLTAMVLFSLATAKGGTTAQTDLASITVTPLTRQAGAKADWQTIFDYSGGTLPPGGSITSEGKWVDPPVRQDQSGVTFAFPDLPDGPENSQFLKIGLGFDRLPITRPGPPSTTPPFLTRGYRVAFGALFRFSPAIATRTPCSATSIPIPLEP